jgi:hypothetical protein
MISSCCTFYLQMDVAAICAAIRDWMHTQILGIAGDLDQLICDDKTLRSLIEPSNGGGPAFSPR